MLLGGFTSCIKDDVAELGDAGSSFVRFTQAPENKLFYRPFTEVKTVTLFDLARDVNSNTVLNQSASIKVSYAPNLVEEYNTLNGDNYLPLLESGIGVLETSASIVNSGNDYTFNYVAGELSKEFNFLIDGSKWDLANKYLAPFVISDSSNYSNKSGLDTIYVVISSKNKYDGVYEVSGTMEDVTTSTLTHINDFLAASGASVGLGTKMQFELRTISATKCVVYDNYFFGGYWYPITSSASYSRWGSFSTIFEFDLTTDKVIGVTNYYGQPASNTREALIDSSGANVYDSVSKTISVKYYMLQPNVVTTAPYIRVKFDEVYTYLGER